MRSYVYKHVDPRNNETVYIGAGSGGRAWVCARATDDTFRYGSRSHDHADWLSKLFDEGFTMGDVVLIVAKGLTKDQAHKLERALLAAASPRFNKIFGSKNAGMTVEQVMWAKSAYGTADFQSYRKVASHLGLPTAMVWRHITGKTRSVKRG